MTTSAVLPSTGAPPPGLRRPEVAAPAARSPASGETRPSAAPQPRAANDGSLPQQGSESGASLGRSRASGVAVQVIESAGIRDSRPAGTSTRLPNQLSEEERAEVSRLSARDREVRAHEAAHQSAGAGYAGSPKFDYVRGPDGRQYAVGGHVEIDTSAVPDDPQATITKMEIVRAAALAPARPSGQDRSVAASAAASIREAEGALKDKRAAEQKAAAEEETQKSEEKKEAAEAGRPAVDAPAAATLAPDAPLPETPAPAIPAPDVPAPSVTPASGGGGYTAPQPVNLVNLFA